MLVIIGKNRKIKKFIFDTIFIICVSETFIVSVSII